MYYCRQILVRIDFYELSNMSTPYVKTDQWETSVTTNVSLVGRVYQLTLGLKDWVMDG